MKKILKNTRSGPTGPAFPCPGGWWQLLRAGASPSDRPACLVRMNTSACPVCLSLQTEGPVPRKSFVPGKPGWLVSLLALKPHRLLPLPPPTAPQHLSLHNHPPAFVQCPVLLVMIFNHFSLCPYSPGLKTALNFSWVLGKMRKIESLNSSLT